MQKETKKTLQTENLERLRYV